MQVTNSATVVDYFPEAFVAEADDIKGMKVMVKRFIKRVYFRATGMKSYSVIVATDAKNEWQSRIAKGAIVTNFNTDKMDRSEYMPLMCWGMSFLSNFTYSKLMQTETMMNEFTIKVSTFKELSEEQIEQLIDKIFDSDPNIFYAERSDKM